MNTRILLLGLATTALTSCATAYRTGQTPDDVYYSPVRPEEEYVQTEKDQYRNNDYYTLDDYRLRMQVRNRNRYCACNDDWYYDDWRYSNSWRYGWNNPWTWNAGINNGWYYSYNSWCYSPYPVRYITTPQRTFDYKPPIRNLATNNILNTYNPKGESRPLAGSKPVRIYNNSNNTRSGSAFGGFLRQILTPSGSGNSSGNYNNSNNNRSYNPSSSGSSSGGSRSSGSSSGSSRPARNGKG